MHRLGKNDRTANGGGQCERDALSPAGEWRFHKSSRESKGLIAHCVLNGLGRIVEAIGSRSRESSHSSNAHAHDQREHDGVFNSSRAVLALEESTYPS